MKCLQQCNTCDAFIFLTIKERFLIICICVFIEVSQDIMLRMQSDTIAILDETASLSRPVSYGIC